MEIAEKMGRAEVIAFATPIDYYEMSGQMKTLLDRANALVASDYAFRDIYLLPRRRRRMTRSRRGRRAA